MLAIKKNGRGYIIGTLTDNWHPGKPVKFGEEVARARDPHDLLSFMNPQQRPKQKPQYGYPSLYQCEIEEFIYRKIKW